MATGSKFSVKHDEIRKWAEKRGAHPARVKGTGGRGDIGMIRLDFPGYSGAKSLAPISWDEFFDKFDENQLALVYRDKTASGVQSNFNKLVKRDTVAVRSRAPRKKVAASRRPKQVSASRRRAA